MESLLLEFKDQPGMDLQTLFNCSVYFNKREPAEYLLKHYRKDINPYQNNFFAIRCAHRNGNAHMIHTIICLGGPSPAIPISVIDKVPPLIAYVLPNLAKSKSLTKPVALKFTDIALMHNDRRLLQCLVQYDIQDFVSDYRYVIVACGANRLDILNQYISIVSEMADECIETAFLCQANDVLKFLVQKYPIANPYLQEKINKVISQIK